MSRARPRLILLAAEGSRIRALVATAAADHPEAELVVLHGAPAAGDLAEASSVWIEAGGEEAVAAASGIRRHHPGLPCVLVLPGRGDPVLEQSLRLAIPGPACLTVAEDQLPEVFSRILEEVERERALQLTLDRLNQRLAAPPSPEEEHRRLLRSDRYLALLLTHVPDAILSADRSWRILSWNHAAVETFGYQASEIAGTAVTALVEAEEAPRAGELLDRAARGEALRGRRIRSRRRDGTVFVSEWTVAPIPDERGEPRGFSLIVRDAEEQSRLEEGHRFLQRLSRSLAETLDYQETLARVAELSVPFLGDWCIIDLAEDGRNLRRMAATHVDPALAPAARELQERFPPHLDSRYPGAEAFRTGRSVIRKDVDDSVLAERTSGPEHRDLLERLGIRSFLAVPLVARDEVIGAATFVRGHSPRPPFDETDLTLAEDVGRRAALAVANARLYTETQRALQAREELTAVVSHDLRNPLNAASMAAALLQRELPPEKRREQVRVIERSLRLMAKLLDDLLDLSRIETGRLQVERNVVEVGPLLREACEDFQGMAAERRSPLLCPETGELPPVFGDRHRLLQVLGNLLSNALKFSSPGQPVELAAEPADGAVRISVLDRGPGLDPEQQRRVFDRFWQAQRGDRRGLGLGLAIARGLVEAHGGRIWVESTPGGGATFRFTVPVADPHSGPVD